MSATLLGLALALGATHPALADQPGGGRISVSGTSFEPDRERRVSAGIFAGGNYFGDDIELGNAYHDDQTPGSAPLFGLRAGYLAVPHMLVGSKVDPRLHVEVEAKLATSSTAGDEMAQRPDDFAPVLGWRAQALVDLWPRARLSPFVVAGVGGETLMSDSSFVASPDTDAALSWGVGARYDLAPRYGLRLDLRQGITAGRSDLITATYEGHLGVFVLFDEPRRTRVERKVIATPAPEPAADPDRDGDGIPDRADRCPDKREVVNDIDDDDGCPEVDSDGDGLLGGRDQCPAAAEDEDGFEDGDGCPDGDNDGDGIADAADSCAREPETDNGFEDNDGCPDEVPEKVERFTGTIEGILFELGSADIRPESRARLEEAVQVLEEHRSIRIEISGHTDSTGSRSVNVMLSHARAARVRQFLVEQGIDGGRIETVGHGPDDPIATNETSAGRAKNRRIEFRLLPRKAAAGAPEAPGAGQEDGPAAEPEEPAEPDEKAAD